jgi:hypothetical protein
MKWKTYTGSPFNGRMYEDTVVSEDEKLWITKFKPKSGHRLQAGLMKDPDGIILDIGVIDNDREYLDLLKKIQQIIAHNPPMKPFDGIPTAAKSKPGESYKKDKIFMAVISAHLAETQKVSLAPSDHQESEEENQEPQEAPDFNQTAHAVRSNVEELATNGEDKHDNFKEDKEESGSELSKPKEPIQEIEMSVDSFMSLMESFNFRTPSAYGSRIILDVDYDIRITATKNSSAIAYNVTFGAYFRKNHLQFERVLTGTGNFENGEKALVMLFDNTWRPDDPDNFIIPQTGPADRKKMKLGFSQAQICQKIFNDLGEQPSQRIGSTTQLFFDVQPFRLKDVPAETNKNFRLINKRRKVIEVNTQSAKQPATENQNQS